MSREILRMGDCNSLVMMIFTIVDNDQVSGAMRRHGIDCGTLARGVKVDLVIFFIFLWLIIDHHDILEGGHLKQEPLPLHPLQSQVAAKQSTSMDEKSPPRCHHAAHAYTGVPCSKYRRRRARRDQQASQDGVLPRLPGGTLKSGRLRSFNPKDPVTLQLKHGGGSQAIRLPTDKLEQNKKYYVRYTCIQDCKTKSQNLPSF